MENGSSLSIMPSLYAVVIVSLRLADANILISGSFSLAFLAIEPPMRPRPINPIVFIAIV